ncbi:MAG: hypothetical protein HY234_05845 [Acidobacteria bacterium]|nr:hypothetical protein [Acidobacteriota bacterium]MBI3662558.1 hypothetical protein [Acidobacteriota bacterium]
MNRRRFFCTPLAAIFLLALSGAATTIVRMSLDELAGATQVVARGKCIASEARWDRGNIWTFTTLEVTETLKGSVPRQVTIRLPGGKVGHATSTVDSVPQFRTGEEVYLFLEPTSAGDLSVTSWVQGTFRVRVDAHTGKETVTQDTAGIAVFDTATRQFKPSGVRHMPVEEFRQRVREALERQRMGK